MRSHNRFHNYVPSLLLFLLFEAVAVTLWLTWVVICCYTSA